MKIQCSNNPKHARFAVTTHVTEGWIVDEHGEFLDVHSGIPGEVIHRPDSDDLYTCLECYSEAKVER